MGPGAAGAGAAGEGDPEADAKRVAALLRDGAHCLADAEGAEQRVSPHALCLIYFSCFPFLALPATAPPAFTAAVA